MGLYLASTGYLRGLAAFPWLYCISLFSVGAILWLVQVALYAVARRERQKAMPKTLKWLNYGFWALAGLLCLIRCVDVRLLLIYPPALFIPVLLDSWQAKKLPDPRLRWLLANCALFVACWVLLLSSLHWWHVAENRLTYPWSAFLDPGQPVFWISLALAVAFGSLVVLSRRRPAASRFASWAEVGVVAVFLSVSVLAGVPGNALSRWTAVRLIVWAQGQEDEPCPACAQGFAERMIGGDLRVASALLTHPAARVRMAAVRSIAATRGPEAFEALLEAFATSSDQDIRGYCASHLGLSGDQRAVEPMIAGLRDEAVRAAAAGALGHLRDRRAVGPLLRLLGGLQRPDDEEERRLGRAFSHALSCLVAPEDVPALAELLSSSNWRTRSDGAWLLGHARGTAAVALLAEALGSDGHGEVRRNAAWSLSQIRDEGSVRALLAALEDSDPEVRAACAVGLSDTRQAGIMTQAVLDALRGAFQEETDQRTRQKMEDALNSIQRQAEQER